MSERVADVWSTVASLDAAAQERLAGVLETRGADPRQQAMRRVFLADVPFPLGARVLDIGCGTGVLTRVIAGMPGIGSVIGVDPAPSLLAKARQLSPGLNNITFEEADGRDLSFDNQTFDAAIFDSTLSHVPGPERALAEAHRVLKPGGILGVFDGDYATTTVALGSFDPLQVCVEAMMASSVNDRWVVRRLPGLVRACGFKVIGSRSHGYVEAGEGSYMLTVIDRGVDLLSGRGQIGDETALALKAEARRRVAAGTFFGHIAYGSLVAQKPA